MAKRTRTYVAFDADTDIRYYRLMQAWHANDGIDFDFNNAHDLTTIRSASGEEAIKASLRERMRNSKNLVILIGENTKNLRKYVPWEIEIAKKANLPIIAANLNGSKKFDSDRCPATLRGELSIHIPFEVGIMQYALDHWPVTHAEYRAQQKNVPFSYNQSVYDKLYN